MSECGVVIRGQHTPASCSRSACWYRLRRQPLQDLIVSPVHGSNSRQCPRVRGAGARECVRKTEREPCVARKRRDAVRDAIFCKSAGHVSISPVPLWVVCSKSWVGGGSAPRSHHGGHALSALSWRQVETRSTSVTRWLDLDSAQDHLLTSHGGLAHARPGTHDCRAVIAIDSAPIGNA